MPLFPISNYQPILNKKYLSKALMGRKDIKQKMNQTQTAMQIFEYQGNEVRTIQHGNEVWWVLRDVCRVLSLSNPHKVAERLEEDERNLIPLIDSMGRTQKNTIVNEPGLYSVILRSDKPEAKTFKRWVTHEVFQIVFALKFLALGR